ncbi:MAG: hypothetical protein EOM91_20295 [Sphingobacteriia bacterium]|nr:hypothetical protein [Sphingobacteriia bacterium]
MTPDAPLTDLAALRRRYDGFLLDAYGVLLDGERALPGAAALLLTWNATVARGWWSPTPPAGSPRH